MDPNTEIREGNSPGPGPLYNVVDGLYFTTGGHSFFACVHGGYNAMGLIGTEANGVALVSLTKKTLVFAEHMRRGMGLDYRKEKAAEARRIAEMTADELREFLDSNPRIVRLNPLAPPHKTPPLSPTLIKRFIQLVDDPSSCSYNDVNKAFFHATGKRILRKLAKALKMAPGTFDIRSNKAGVACSGEVTLHSDNWYIQFSVGCSSQMGFMVRACDGRKDYSGGPNHWMSWDTLFNIPDLVKRIGYIRNPKLQAA